MTPEFEDIFQRFRIQREDSLKGKFPKNIINDIHDNIYKTVKQVILPIPKEISEACSSDYRLPLELGLTALRILLDANPKEKEVQNKLLELEKYAKLRTASLSEVYVKKSTGKKGRIDMLARPANKRDLGRIIELKRPSMKLDVYKHSQRISAPLKNAIRQVGEYHESNLVVKDTNSGLEEAQLSSMKKTIVAGQRFQFPGKYILIAEEEKKDFVEIYSWDAWIDRFERIYT